MSEMRTLQVEACRMILRYEENSFVESVMNAIEYDPERYPTERQWFFVLSKLKSLAAKEKKIINPMLLDEYALA